MYQQIMENDRYLLDFDFDGDQKYHIYKRGVTLDVRFRTPRIISPGQVIAIYNNVNDARMAFGVLN